LYQETEAPKPPTSISTEPTETGVNLRWEDLQNNVYGFYVYRMNGFSEALEQISPLILPDTSRQYVYADTSDLLKGNQYYSYAVKTVNDSYLLSGFSDTLSVRPAIPTTIDTPLGLRTRKDGKTVYLFWNDMQTTHPDLQGYKVYRQRSDEAKYQEITEVLAANHYQDTTIEEGYAYTYAVQALDYYGAVSELSYPAQVAFYLRLPVPPSGIKVLPAAEGITVSWGEVRQPALSQYHLYRYEPGKEVVRVAEISKDQFQHTDRAVEKGKLYFYYLTSVNDSRMEGDKGKAVSIRY
jgi:fibronectin type 3 domain-containing protein